MVRVDLTYRGKCYVVEIDSDSGCVQRVKTAYERVHGSQRLGVLRSIFPLKGIPSETTLAVIHEAENQWRTQIEKDGLTEIKTVYLGSATVFWSELGYQESQSNRVRAATLFDASILPWLQANAKHAYNPHKDGVWFANLQDAALFKMMFHGCFDA